MVLPRPSAPPNLALLTKPSLSRSVLATCNSRRHPSGSRLSCARIFSVAVGGRGAVAQHQPTMPSRHHIQFVPQSADPILPIIGSVVMSRAIAICSWLPGKAPNNAIMVWRIPSWCPVAYLADWVGAQSSTRGHIVGPRVAATTAMRTGDKALTGSRSTVFVLPRFSCLFKLDGRLCSD